MIVVYTIYDVFWLLVGKWKYKKFINPISIYAAVWGGAVLIHESGLIRCYPLTAFTWVTIFLFQFIFSFLCFLFANGTRQPSLNYFGGDEKIEEKYRKKVFFYICLTGGLAAVAILFNFSQIVAYYGKDVLRNFTEIYHDRIQNVVSFRSIPYLGSLSMCAISICGYYLRRYGFSPIMIVVAGLPLIETLTTGGRANLVFAFLLFFFSYHLTNKPEKIAIRKKKDRLLYVLLILTLCLLIIYISGLRSSGAELTYASAAYIRIFGNNAVVYKLLTYVTGPIGALNEYLRTMDFNFAQNTFLWVYNMLARLGLCSRIEQYQEWFYMPMGCNVATWIRELIEDFTYPIAIICACIFGFFVSRSYNCAWQQKESGILCSSIYLMIIALSFFDWRIRSFGVWIALICNYIIGKRLEKKKQV